MDKKFNFSQKLNFSHSLFLLLILAVHTGGRVQQKPAPAGGGIETVALHFELFAGGFSFISSLDFAADGRLFAADILGRVKIVQPDGTVNPILFLDLQGQVGNSGKQALSGFVLHPQFQSNGRFFVSYTSPDNITYLSRFQTMPGDPDQADPDSEEILLAVTQPTDIHNGAGLIFGPDSYLYYGLGDGGYYNDPDNNGQNGNTFLGAILRLDVDGALPYEIPPDNPFTGDPDVLDEIWAMGLRNPWRFDFDPLTDDLYIADVGEMLWEEISFEPAGSGGGFNYGWRCYQGFEPYITAGCGPPELYTPPVYVHTHSTMCAVIGGELYRGNLYPMMAGHYLFADLCSGRIYGLLRQLDGGFTIASTGMITGGNVTTFGEDQTGELFAAAGSKIYRVSAETITLTPQSYLPSIQFTD